MKQVEEAKVQEEDSKDLEEEVLLDQEYLNFQCKNDTIQEGLNRNQEVEIP